MMLIADSGSTKADWKFINGNEIKSFQTIGLNPFFISESEISMVLESAFSNAGVTNAERVYFYGAGCASEEKCKSVENGINHVLPFAAVTVASDMLGAARALYGKEEGIAAILGTGANTCFYNGDTITDKVPSLGFILGDEGSGAHLGKQFIGYFLRNDLPVKMHDKFLQKYGLTKDKVLNAVYKEPNPNRWLAALTGFLYENKKNEFVRNMLIKCFTEFFEKQIFKYENNKECKIRISGSVGFYFQDILLSIAALYGLTVDKIIQSPIDELVAFHS